MNMSTTDTTHESPPYPETDQENGRNAATKCSAAWRWPGWCATGTRSTSSSWRILRRLIPGTCGQLIELEHHLTTAELAVSGHANVPSASCRDREGGTHSGNVAEEPAV